MFIKITSIADNFLLFPCHFVNLCYYTKRYFGVKFSCPLPFDTFFFNLESTKKQWLLFQFLAILHIHKLTVTACLTKITTIAEH